MAYTFKKLKDIEIIEKRDNLNLLVEDNGKIARTTMDNSNSVTQYELPILYLIGDTSPIAINKDNKVTLNYIYEGRSGTCTLKGQGATSYRVAQALIQAGKAGKFNYTIKFDTPFEAKAGWGAQQKYCLKANYIDATHSRNIVSCILWGMSVKSRSSAPATLTNLPNGGAIDGFPVIIMLNGKFHGLYTWNIPKDGWMFGLEKDSTRTQAIVGADDHTTATQFKEASMSGFEVEFASDESNTDWVSNSLTRMLSAVINSNGSDLDTTVAQYLDLDSCIDHYIHTVIDKATDCVDKNYLLVTFDGIKWYMSAYDRDSIHGLNWDASGTTRPVSNVSFTECATTVRIYDLIKRFKTNALKARYRELRSNILSESRIMEKFENFAWAIPAPLMMEDVKLYPTILGSSVNTIDQIGRFVRQRLIRCDEWIEDLPNQEEPVPTVINQVPISTDLDGTIYNGVGYKNDVRLSSSGGVSGTAQIGSVVTGFIPYTYPAIVQIKGATWANIPATEGHYYVNAYNANRTFIAGVAATDDFAPEVVSYDASTGTTTFDFSKWSDTNATRQAFEQASFIRLNAKGSGANLIVTLG